MLRVKRGSPAWRELVFVRDRAGIVCTVRPQANRASECRYTSSPLPQRLFASSTLASHLYITHQNTRSQNNHLDSCPKSEFHSCSHQFKSKRQFKTRTFPSINSEICKSTIIIKEAQSSTRRLFSSRTSSQSSAVHAVTRYAFAGKPRTAQAEEEKQRQYAGTGEVAIPNAENSQPRQGFLSSSTIGAWVDATLKKGEAGEDALLFQKMKGEGDVLYGVADGVGGWSENGIDPALFSQSLLYHSADYAKDFFACPERLEVEDFEHKSYSSSSSSTNTPPSTPPTSPGHSNKASTAEPGTPLDILQYAYQKTLQQVEVPAGSATACIVSFDASKGIIRTANLGDSGFLVLRPSNASNHEDLPPEATGMPFVHYQSKPQTHGFNTPLQLSKLPPEFISEGSIDSKPSNADLWSGRVLDGDMVLVATDGFWDNVSVNEVLQLVNFIKDKHRAAFVDRMLDISNNPLAEEEDLADVLANNLLSYALMCQFSVNKPSPFEREAARYGIRYPGGKVDDVAIIVSLIVER